MNFTHQGIRHAQIRTSDIRKGTYNTTTSERDYVKSFRRCLQGTCPPTLAAAASGRREGESKRERGVRERELESAREILYPIPGPLAHGLRTRTRD